MQATQLIFTDRKTSDQGGEDISHQLNNRLCCKETCKDI